MKQPTENAVLKALLVFGYVVHALKKPVTWLAVLLAASAWWVAQQYRAAQIESSRLPPVTFTPPAPRAGGEKLPVEVEPEEVDPKEEPSVVPSQVLETAVGRFHRDHRRPPIDFEELESARYIVGVPRPPEGMRYQLDLRRMKLRLVRR